jgi:hypothetical protein
MRKYTIAVIVVLAASLLLAPTNALAAVTCPEHSYATCYDTGRVKSAADGGLLHLYHCTCNDDWWVRE